MVNGALPWFVAPLPIVIATGPRCCSLIRPPDLVRPRSRPWLHPTAAYRLIDGRHQAARGPAALPTRHRIRPPACTTTASGPCQAASHHSGTPTASWRRSWHATPAQPAGMNHRMARKPKVPSAGPGEHRDRPTALLHACRHYRPLSSSATSMIMSSWPPTTRRRPSSRMMSAALTWYCAAARRVWSRNEL